MAELVTQEPLPAHPCWRGLEEREAGAKLSASVAEDESAASTARGGPGSRKGNIRVGRSIGMKVSKPRHESHRVKSASSED
jgi:hypothetical protein